MSKIILSVGATGTVEMTRDPDLPPLAFRGVFEEITMFRISEISLHRETGMFYIQWLATMPVGDDFCINIGDIHGLDHHAELFGTVKPEVFVHIHETTRVFLFRAYEDAARYEVACVDEVRRRGHRFSEKPA